eukprot:9658068-Ditylum_brightwellii.AAC.1
MAFLDRETNDRVDTESDGEEEKNVMGPEAVDPYNGPHRLRPGVASSFTTALQCMFTCSDMDEEFFKHLTANSNKYACTQVLNNNTSTFIGHKQRNITRGEVVHFFSILLRISMEPSRMNGCVSYFEDDPFLNLGHGYHIYSAFYLEVGDSKETGDKCHHLRYFIWRLNHKARNVFYFGRDAAFDEGSVPMRSCYCPVHQYNKDKPDTFCVNFFILADAKYLFIYQLDVYQGKNKNNIDIHPDQICYTTIVGDHTNEVEYSCCSHLQIQQKIFPSDELELNKNAQCGEYVCKVDPCIGMVVTRWNDSRLLQTSSTVMVKGTTTVQ